MRRVIGLSIIAVLVAVELTLGVHLLQDGGKAILAEKTKKFDAAIMASGTYIKPDPKSNYTLEEQVVKILKGEPGDKKKAKEQVLETTLQALELAHWLEAYGLNYNIIFGDVHPASGEELVISVSVGKDNGLVAVYIKEAQGYQIAGALTELVPVTRLSIVGLPGLNYKALVIDEYLDELSGAFFKVKTKSVYVFKGEILAKVWERERYRKEYWPEGDKIQGDQTRWLMLTEEAAIVFLPEGKIKVSGVRTQGRRKTLGFEMDGDYEITKKEQVKEMYVWDADKLSFKRE